MSDSSRIRVLLTDDHAVVRSGLSAFLMAFDDLQLVAEAESGEEAIGLCDQYHPDVVLMDLKMPGVGGTEATRRIKAHWPDIAVIALTSFSDRETVETAIEAGAVGDLMKSVSAEELAQAITAAEEGRPTLAPEAAKALMTSAAGQSEPEVALTRREQEVLHLMVEGLNNREIAERLTISLSTVKCHVSSVLTKLDAENRTDAVALAFRYGS
jgi:NarL family two-component system response regulator LiaR